MQTKKGVVFQSNYRRFRRGLNNRQVKQVQKIINKNRRLKVFQEYFLETIDSGDDLKEFTAIPEGDDIGERDTDTIHLMSIKLMLSINNHATATVQRLRVMVARGRNGPLAIGDFPATPGTAPDLDKIQVYYDEIINLPAVDIDPFQIRWFKSFKTRRIPHLNVRYDDAASATAAQHNPVYLFMSSSEATNGASVAGYIITKFYDVD